MATFLVYFSRSGAPAAGLAPVWSSLRETGGADRLAEAPAVSEIGGGWYRFEASKGAAPWDAADLVGVLDGGEGLSGAERYLPVILSEQTLERQTEAVLRESVSAHKAAAGSLAADVNLVRQAVAGRRTQEVATGTIRIYDEDYATVLRTLQPTEQDGVLIVDDQ